MSTGSPAIPAARASTRRRSRGQPTALLPTILLLVGAFYCLVPILWVLVAATKSSAQLFDSFTFAPGSALVANIQALSAYRGLLYWRWMANSALYAGGGAILSAALSGLTGYTLAKLRFRGRTLAFNLILAAVLVPNITLAIPQYLLLAKIGLANSYLSVLLPSILSPYGIYLSRVYAAAAVDDSVIESARVDGAPELRIFLEIAAPMMLPGLVTVFLIQFIAIWNNFLLPFIMLSDDQKFPMTVGLYTVLNQGIQLPALYNLVITGSLLSILPLAALFLLLQRYWRIDLISGAVRG